MNELQNLGLKQLPFVNKTDQNTTILGKKKKRIIA